MYSVKITLSIQGPRGVSANIEYSASIASSEDLEQLLKTIRSFLTSIMVSLGEEEVRREVAEGAVRVEHIVEVLKEMRGQLVTTEQIVEAIERKYGYRPRPQAVALLLATYVLKHPEKYGKLRQVRQDKRTMWLYEG